MVKQGAYIYINKCDLVKKKVAEMMTAESKRLEKLQSSMVKQGAYTYGQSGGENSFRINDRGNQGTEEEFS